jgi:hypothetical protein
MSAMTACSIERSRCILILTQYYPPEMGALQARMSELAQRLRTLGWDV